MIELVWTQSALDDLEAIDDYWLVQDPRIADDSLSRIRAAAEFLCDTPRSGTPLSIAGVRKWRVAGTQYFVVYRVVSARLDILRIYHARMNWRDAW